LSAREKHGILEAMHPNLQQNVTDIVRIVFSQEENSEALIVFDPDSPLSLALTEAYRQALPKAEVMNFHETSADAIRTKIDTLSPGQLVILIQSTNFRLNEFRFRLELFNRNLAVIEHPHLGRMIGDEEQTYVDALAYDPAYYRVVGPALKKRIDTASRVVVYGEGTELVYESPFESGKINIGDYSTLKNTGGQFPIGEVFTEPVDLTNVNGTANLHAFGDKQFRVISPKEPIRVRIEQGKIVEVFNPTPAFQEVIDQIKEEEELWVRELGFGMNRALTRERRLIDVGSYERMCGIHVSLGEKHPIYKKPGFSRRGGHFHVDVFVDAQKVTIDGETVFENGSYTVTS
jgi:hypothetical protein